MRNVFKKLTAITLTATLAVGMTSAISAAVSKGTDVSAGKKWTSFSIYTKEDHVSGESSAKKNVCWYHNLTTNNDILKEQHYVNEKVTDDQIKKLNEAIKANNEKRGTKTPLVTKHADTWGEQDSYKCFGENAKITTQTASSFLMDVTSTGWSADWGPIGGKDKNGNLIYLVTNSNPWGVTADKVVNVERGRYYNISFKIKSTLKNEIKEAKERTDGTGYNVGTGKYNYVKHIHFKAYDNKDEGGAARQLIGLKATQGGKSVLEKGNKSFSSFIKLDSKNTADDGWVSVSAKVLIPSEKEDWQGNTKNPTLAIKFALGAFLKEYPDENDMSGTIEVKDFKILADAAAAKPAKVKKLKVKAGKKSLTISFKKAKNAKKYEVQYSLKKNFKKATTKSTSKTKLTVKKLKAGKKYYVRVRGVYTTSGSKICGSWVKNSKAVKVKK